MSIITDKIETLIQSIDGKGAKPDNPMKKVATCPDDEKSLPQTSSDKARILLADKLGPFVESALKRNGFNVLSDPSLKNDALKDAMAKYQPNVIVVRSTKVTKDHLLASSDLALVVRAGAGYNTIAVDDASNMGIFVSNCPGKNAIAVAELAMGHLINLDRRIADNVMELRAGKWNKKEFGKARGLYGRTLAVLGVGNIGSEVCKRAVAFGMTVNGYSRSLTPQIAADLGINYCKTLKDACANVDAVSIHLPHNKETHHIINREILSMLKDGAFVVNTSRGGVVNESDMLLMIDEKQLRYAPDVYDDEPDATDKTFGNKSIGANPNIYGSHHIGASTGQASDAVGAEALRVIQTFLNDGHVVNCVNLEDHSPAKYQITIRHNSVIGVLAEILTILRGSGVNVQEMSNVIFKGAKSACATLQIDTKPSDESIAKLRKLDNVYGVRISAK